MLKRILSIIWWIKIKLYIKWIEADMMAKLRRGESLPKDYLWIRLDKMIRGRK